MDENVKEADSLSVKDNSDLEVKTFVNNNLAYVFLNHHVIILQSLGRSQRRELFPVIINANFFCFGRLLNFNLLECIAKLDKKTPNPGHLCPMALSVKGITLRFPQNHFHYC